MPSFHISKAKIWCGNQQGKPKKGTVLTKKNVIKKELKQSVNVIKISKKSNKVKQYYVWHGKFNFFTLLWNDGVY